MDTCSELAIDVLTNFSEFYIRNNEMQKSMRVSNEMETIDDEYSSAYEAANEYLQSRQDDRSNVTSETLTIEMLEKNGHFRNQQEGDNRNTGKSEAKRTGNKNCTIKYKQPCQLANTRKFAGNSNKWFT